MGEYSLHVNGTTLHVTAPPDEALLWVLRDRLDLTGTKYGCGEGQCGACTVLVNGEPMRSCRISVETAGQSAITTIEGLEKGGKLSAVQEAFLDEGAFQCGYCTSGMILAATALLASEPHPSEARIVDAMNGHVCRCGTYPRIVAAVQRAADAAQTGGAQ